MKIFTSKLPNAVRCRDCQHCPQKRGQRCDVASKRVMTLGGWRRCSSFMRKTSGLKEVELAKNNRDTKTYRWQHIGAFCDDLYLGTEPLWSYIGDEASENAVLEDLRLWLRHKRSQAFHQDEIRRRRAAIKSVQDRPDLGKS